MATHEQVWVKVNAPVDAGIADIVALLNSVDGLETLQSCAGFMGESPAFVYLSYGDWNQLGTFLFGKVLPALPEKLRDEVSVSVEMFNGSKPIGKLRFNAEATPIVTSALKLVFG